MIDWTKPAEAICHHVRAMQPWPTAYSFLHRPGKELMRVIFVKCGTTWASGMPPSMLESSSPLPGTPRCIVPTTWTSGSPGSTLESSRPSGSRLPHNVSPFTTANRELAASDTPLLWVACSAGTSVEVQVLQPAGKKPMTAEEFLRGNPIVEGMRFGPEVLA